jgi:RNA polymerase sigma-70 factor (ECF subfamily)
LNSSRSPNVTITAGSLERVELGADLDSSRLREHVLVLRAQVGDEEAFSDLFRRFGEKTHRYLVSLVGDSAADDVQQEVWVSVYRRIGSLANPVGFRTWLFQITRNQGIDYLRKIHREQVVQAEAEPMLDDPAGPAVEDVEFDVDDQAIAAAMGTLSPRHREVLVLRFWRDLTYPEMALVIGAPVGTVRSRLHHAKRLLREELEARQPRLATTLEETREIDHEH